MRNTKYKFCFGLTLIELIVSMVMSTIVILTTGVLLVSGQRAWQHTYESAHKQTRQDAQATMITFGSIGRKANRLGYTIYEINNGSFVPAEPETANPEEVLFGDAVEFRYWDVELDETDSHNLMDITKTATAYALFYIDGDKLKVDYSKYPPRAVPSGGGIKNSTDITTTTLARNVSTESDNTAFSHTTLNGVGQGCVKIDIILTSPDDPTDVINVKTATLMRNIWPR